MTEHDTPLLWRYLREEIGVAELTAQSMVQALTSEFLSSSDRRLAGPAVRVPVPASLALAAVAGLA